MRDRSAHSARCRWARWIHPRPAHFHHCRRRCRRRFHHCRRRCRRRFHHCRRRCRRRFHHCRRRCRRRFHHCRRRFRRRFRHYHRRFRHCRRFHRCRRRYFPMPLSLCLRSKGTARHRPPQRQAPALSTHLCGSGSIRTWSQFSSSLLYPSVALFGSRKCSQQRASIERADTKFPAIGLEIGSRWVDLLAEFA